MSVQHPWLSAINGTGAEDAKQRGAEALKNWQDQQSHIPNSVPPGPGPLEEHVGNLSLAKRDSPDE